MNWKSFLHPFKIRKSLNEVKKLNLWIDLLLYLKGQETVLGGDILGKLLEFYECSTLGKRKLYDYLASSKKVEPWDPAYAAIPFAIYKGINEL